MRSHHAALGFGTSIRRWSPWRRPCGSACGIGSAPTIPSERRSPSSTNTRSCRLEVSPRFRGFHRYDLTTCIACERCARDCPVGCIYIGKERVAGRKGFQITSYTIDYGKCMFCAICTENCPVDCIFMGSSYDLSCYSREGCIVDFSRLPLEVAWGPRDAQPHGGGQLEGHRTAGSRRSRFVDPRGLSRSDLQKLSPSP